MQTNINKTLRVHLTNVTGVGASQLSLSLLPALERNDYVEIVSIELPDRGILASYKPQSTSVVVNTYHRLFPRAVSRLIECTILAPKYNGNTPLLVLGDLPLRCNARQIVFVQQSHLFSVKSFTFSYQWLKFAIMRQIFRSNLRYVHEFIVQTHLMRYALENKYPSIAGRVHVIGQPVPNWLLYSGLKRTPRSDYTHTPLTLFYPAAIYPHKNHSLLCQLGSISSLPVKELILTIDPDDNPSQHLPFVSCKGFLSEVEMLQAYTSVDSLLFLSKEESFGFPLVEAMYVGIPIIAPELPYARELCGDGAIYFDPDDVDSLCNAITLLHSRLHAGWWPDWSSQLMKLPRDWEEVAQQISEVVYPS